MIYHFIMESTLTRKCMFGPAGTCPDQVLRYAACLFSLLVMACAPAAAQGTLGIELNKLESVEDSCRAYMVFKNDRGGALESLKLDLVMFDLDGLIIKRLAVEGGPLPVGKTSVRLFDITDVSCGEVGQVLLNDVLDCSGPAGEEDDCLNDIDTTSRSSALFFK